MAQLTPYEGSDVMSLRDAMNRLFDESFLRLFAAAAEGTRPALDMAETDDEIVVKAAVPGLKPDDLKLQVMGNVLEISGQARGEAERKGATYHLRERRQSSFRRLLTLPSDVNADKAKADFENGVLTLTLPKMDDQRRMTISIKPKTK